MLGGGAQSLLSELTCSLYMQTSFRNSPKFVMYKIRDDRFASEKEYYENRYQKIPAVEEAVKQKLGKEIIVRTDVQQKITLVLFKDSEFDYRLFHLLQSFVPILIPWQFEGKPLNDLEKDMLNALAGRRPSVYLDVTRKLFESLNIRKELIRRSITRLGSGLFQSRIDEMNRNIASYQQEADRALARFEDFMRRKKEANVMLMGLMAQGTDTVDNSDLIDLFTKNPNYELSDCSGTSIRFTIYTTISSFDSSYAKASLSSDRSYFYTNSSWSNPDSKMFFNALFGDRPVLKLRVFAGYALDVQGIGCVGRTVDHTRPGCIGNPHIQRFHCLGTYRGEIDRFIAGGDTMQAVLQCAMSAASLNMEDSAVMSWLVSHLTGGCERCIELPDGSVVTPDAALAWLKNGGTEHGDNTVNRLLEEDDDDDAFFEVETAEAEQEEEHEEEPEEMAINF